MGEVLTFGAIAEFFKEEIKLISRLENAVKSRHIKTFAFDAELWVIRGEVYASMKNKFYNVIIYLDSSFKIEKATCTCPRGQYICHHMAALSIAAKTEISVTDTSCGWSVRKPNTRSTVTIEELHPSRSYTAVNQGPTAEDEENFVKSLGQYGTAVGFTWLLKPKLQPNELKLVVDVEDLLFSKEFLESSNRRTYILDAMNMDEKKIEEVVAATLREESIK